MATRTYRYRIEPNREQQQKLSMFFGCAQERYNTVGATGIQACGDGASTLRETVGRALPKAPVTGRKQEIHDVSEVAGRTEAHDFSRG